MVSGVLNTLYQQDTSFTGRQKAVCSVTSSDISLSLPGDLSVLVVGLFVQRVHVFFLLACALSSTLFRLFHLDEKGWDSALLLNSSQLKGCHHFYFKALLLTC